MAHALIWAVHSLMRDFKYQIEVTNMLIKKETHTHRHTKKTKQKQKQNKQQPKTRTVKTILNNKELLELPPLQISRWWFRCFTNTVIRENGAASKAGPQATGLQVCPVLCLQGSYSGFNRPPPLHLTVTQLHLHICLLYSREESAHRILTFLCPGWPEKLRESSDSLR